MQGTIYYVAQFVFNASVSLAPFFLISVSVASLIKTFELEKNLKKGFHGKQAASVTVAAGAGALSPLCSCGVIPAIAAMLAAGIPLAPIMSFWITSPLMSPESFVLTYSVLGKDLALARLIATLAIGLVAGYSTMYLVRIGFIENEILKNNAGMSESRSCCQEKQALMTRKEKWIAMASQFLVNAKDMGIFIGKYILIAFVLEALIVRYVPMEWVGRILGSGNEAGPLLAALLGVPAYSSSISAIPVVRGLMDLGMDQGTALSFLIGGAATSIPAMAAVFSIVKGKVFLLYLSYSMLGAVTAGYLFRLIV